MVLFLCLISGGCPGGRGGDKQDGTGDGQADGAAKVADKTMNRQLCRDFTGRGDELAGASNHRHILSRHTRLDGDQCATWF
jgi:hypothetical protein